jgi:hypothetical protein
MRVIPRGRGNTSAASLAALLGVLLLLIVTAYLPFQWDPPRVVSNEVARRAGGSLRFGEMNRARTPGSPAWLADARASGIIQIELEVAPQTSQEHSPASIMMLASDFWHTDFAIAQNHSDLLLWLRRPGSDSNGGPMYAVGAALQSRRWNRVVVRVAGDDLWIDVNGSRRLTEHLPADALSVWGPGRVALGDEVHGGVPWQGEIRKAEVSTPDQVVDYVSPGALSIPVSYLYFPDHVAPFQPLNRGTWATLVLHLVSFIPVGFLIVWSRRPPVRPIPATVLAIAVALTLAAGKFLFHGRHTEAGDILVQSAGALLGALLAWRWAHRREQEHRDSPSWGPQDVAR